MMTKSRGPRQHRSTLAELNEQLRQRVGIEELARRLVPDLRRAGNSLRADSLNGNTTEGPRQAFSILLTGPTAGKWRDFGAGKGGDLIDLIAATHGLSVSEAAAKAREWVGTTGRSPHARASGSVREEGRGDDDGVAKARAMWRQAGPLGGSLGATYLQTRGLKGPWPSDIRYHGQLYEGSTGEQWPALVAAIRDENGLITAVQRTYLARDGGGKAPLPRPKLMRGRASGGAVRLGPNRPVLAVCEGLETGLSIRAALMRQHPQLVICCCGSVDHVAAFVVPEWAREVLDCRDGNPAGSEAAGAAEAATERLRRFGKPVTTIEPPEGLDMDDVRRRGGLAAVKALFEAAL